MSIAINSKQFKTACMLAEHLSRRNMLTCEMKNKFKGSEYYENIKNLPDIGSGYIISISIVNRRKRLSRTQGTSEVPGIRKTLK